MKIAMVIPNLNIEGAQSMAVQLAENLCEKSIEIFFVVFNQKKDNKYVKVLDEKGIKIYFYENRPGNPVLRKLTTYKWLCRVLEKSNPDIIHTHLDYFSWLYALVYKKRIVITVHSQPYRICKWWSYFLYKYLNRKDLVTTVVLTESMRKEFSDLFKVSENDLCLIPNPVKLEHCELKKENHDTINFVSIARFHPIKNHWLLLEAFSEVAYSNRNVKLFLAGDGKLLESEKEHAKRLKISDRVVFLGQVDDINSLLNSCDIYVNSSDSEALPMTVLEAMSFGLPIIATDVGGLRDIINENGIKVPPGNKEIMARAMINMIENKKLREEYGKKSLKLVESYSVDNIGVKYLEEYKKIFKGK